MDTVEKLLQASSKVFTKHGYVGSSTKAIAEAAGVAEMTLFRKFGSKQNLFEEMIKYTLGHELSDGTVMDYDVTLDTFLHNVLHHRLTIISTHIDLVRMIIQESLQGRLSKKMNYIQVMKAKLEALFGQYCEVNDMPYDPMYPETILSTILKYAILNHHLGFHRLNQTKQTAFVTQQLKLVNLQEINQ